MAKHKIPKNRSIEDMFQGVEEEATFETTGWEDDEVSGQKVGQEADRIGLPPPVLHG